MGLGVACSDGIFLGAIAISVANPTGFVKLSLQAEGKLAPGVPRCYTGIMDAYAMVVRLVRYGCKG